MKIKQKLKPFIYAAAVLCMSLSCKKEDPCGPASCCGAPDQKMRFIKNLENARADIGIAGDFIVEGLKDEYTKQPSSAGLCYLQEQSGTFAGQLKPTHDSKPNTPQTYKYRVWGTIYNCDSCPTFSISNVYYFKLTKIEYQN